MGKDFNSIDDIDNALDKEFNINDLDNEEDNNDNSENNDFDNNSQNDTDGAVDENDTEDQSSDNHDNDENGESDEVKDTKSTEIDKKEYAFKQLRQENSDFKRKNQELEDEANFLKTLANSYGYTDVSKFKEDVRNAQLANEAKEKGVPLDVYKKLDESSRKIAELERVNSEIELKAKADVFKNAMDEVISKYNMTDVERNYVFDELGKAGYEVKDLLNLPQPKYIIEGVLSSKINEFNKQNQLKKMEEMDNLADDKQNNGYSGSKLSLDDLIAAEMKEYEANF